MADDNTQHEHNTELPEGHGALAHQIHSDTFSVLGLTISLPGGIYTGVFLVLGILTALEVAIADDLLDQTIEAISKSATTGKIGDGKIFVTHLEQIIRIRTGETGEDAV